MKKKLIQILQPLLGRCGLRLLRSKDYGKLCRREGALIDMLNRSVDARKDSDVLDLEFVVFSMDRALQLHGLLSSLFDLVQGDYTVHVLYRASEREHERAYDEVKMLMEGAGRPVRWSKESDFRQDLIDVLDSGGSSQVAFLVDDIVFIRPLDLTKLDWAACRNGVLSLRLGKGLDYCYTKGRPMRSANLSPVSAEGELMRFSWTDGEYDWVYPVSVDGHVFSRLDMRSAVGALEFGAPNSFERALQVISPLYEPREGFCFDRPKILNIPLNKVQTENDNVSADVSPRYLLEQWNQGKMLDYKSLQGISTRSVHQEVDVRFCTRPSSF